MTEKPKTELPKQCPYCGAPVKHPSKPSDLYLGYTTPVTFTCGTDVSLHWSPPLRGKNCIAK